MAFEKHLGLRLLVQQFLYYITFRTWSDTWRDCSRVAVRNVLESRGQSAGSFKR